MANTTLALAILGLLFTCYSVSAAMTCRSPDQELVTTVAEEGDCHWYHNQQGCCGDLKSNPMPPATVAPGYGSHACGSYSKCAYYINLLLCGIHCQPSWEDGKFVICEKFADDLWYQCESAGSYNIDSCVTNEELGFTRDSYIEHILGQNFTIHKPSDAKNPGSECFNSSSQTIVSLALLFVAAIVAILF